MKKISKYTKAVNLPVRALKSPSKHTFTGFTKKINISLSMSVKQSPEIYLVFSGGIHVYVIPNNISEIN